MASVIGQVFPVLVVNVERSHVTLAGVLEVELRTTNGTLARSKFTVQQFLWDATILHPMDMFQPAQSTLSELSVHCGKVVC